MSVQISKLAKCVCSEIMIVSMINAKHPKQREEYSEGASTYFEKNKLVEQILTDGVSQGNSREHR